MLKLENLKIARKLGLVLVAGILQLVCVGGLALWSVNSIENAASQSRQEDRKQFDTQRVDGGR